VKFEQEAVVCGDLREAHRRGSRDVFPRLWKGDGLAVNDGIEDRPGTPAHEVGVREHQP
jgi:hypothetical protein